MKQILIFIHIIIVIVITSCSSYYDQYKERELLHIKKIADVIISNPQAIQDILTHLQKSDMLTQDLTQLEYIVKSMQEISKFNYKYKYYDEKIFYESNMPYAVPNKNNRDSRYILAEMTYVIVYQCVDDERKFCSFRYKYTDKTGWYLCIVLLQDELNPPYYRL